MSTTRQPIGRAKMTLVFGAVGNQTGILSTVVARVRRRRKGLRLSFVGAVQFSASTRAHITGVILPIVDRILEQLRLATPSFEISAVNVGAASCHELGTEVSGFSADAPVLLAMLSAALEIPLRDDFVATGHIASTHGDIVAVKGIPAKLEAAIADRSVRRFLYGGFERDRSLEVLSPREKDAAMAAIMRACNAIETKAIYGVDELIAEALSEDAILTSSLENGFFHRLPKAELTGDPIARATSFLRNGHDRRFWDLVQRDLSTGECGRAVHFLEIYAASFLGRDQYPMGFGARLLRLVCAVPPTIRQRKLTYPLLDLGRCVELVRLASPSDFADVPLLFDAVRGKVPGDDRLAVQQRELSTSTLTDCELFDAVTAEIGETSLTHKFDIPIDSARASFVLASSTVGSHDEFLGIVESFFIHLQSHMDPDAVTTSDLQQARKEASRLLKRAFWNHGGIRGALARAQAGVDGGVRSVLDTMTERYKAETRAGHIETFLHIAIEAMDHAEQVRFARGAMERLGPMLPAELRNEPPERFANHIDQIARAYAKSTAGIEQLLKTM